MNDKKMVLLMALLLGGFVLMKRKQAMAPVRTTYGSMPGSVGTGTNQQVGGILAGFLTGIKAPANGTQQDGNPMTQSNMANAQYNASASVNDLAAPQDVVNPLPDGGDELASMGF